MGCDIHMTLEERVDGKWICIDTFASHHSRYAKPDSFMDGFSCSTARSRNYERFAALAGVRGEGPAPRGVPDDVSETTRHLIAKWSGDGHSHSWLPVAEAASLFLKTEWLPVAEAASLFLKTEWVPPGVELSDFVVKYPESYYFNVESDCLDNYRLVFWFDN